MSFNNNPFFNNSFPHQQINGHFTNNNSTFTNFNIGSNIQYSNIQINPNFQNNVDQNLQPRKLETPKIHENTEIPVPIIQNIVCTVNLGCKLDLKSISLKARNSEYNPRRFSAAIMRIKDPRTTALIFSSGKVVCTGAKSEDLAKQAMRKFARIIQKLGFKVVFKNFQIQNIVGSCDVRFPIALGALQVAHSKFAKYEHDVFPGLVYRIYKSKVIVLVFRSGKIVLTGAKFRSEINEAFEIIYPILKIFCDKFDKLKIR